MNYQDLQLKFLKAIESFDQLQLSQGAFLIDETQMPVPQVPEFGEDYIVDRESGETGYEHYAWVRVWAMIPSQEVYRDREEERQGYHVIKKYQMVEELLEQMTEQGVPEDRIVEALQQFKSDYDKQVAEEKPIVDEEGYSEEPFDGNSDEDSEEIREEEQTSIVEPGDTEE